MAQDKTADREQRLAESWARWREADYSWEGLLDPRKESYDFESLQQYWRTDPETGEVRDDTALVAAGELIVVEGQKSYHIAHLPLHYEDGTPTAKTTTDTARALHERLTAVIVARLKAAATDEAPLAVMNGLVTIGTLYLFMNHLRACFDWAILAKASFSRVTFSRDASFKNATFSGTANFDSATFSGYTRFDSAIFCGFTRFDSTIFSGDASFLSTIFSGGASFLSATFSRYAYFSSATFSGTANFDSATFSRYAFFDRTTFSGDTRFVSATFSGDTRFVSAIFSGRAQFKFALFEKPLTLDEAVFLGVADFEGDGSGTSRPGASQALSLSRRADKPDQFEGSLASLDPPSLATLRRIPSIAASGTVFLGEANFSNRDIPNASTFKDARFYGAVCFHDGKLHPEVIFPHAQWQPSLDFPPSAAALPPVPDRALKALYEAAVPEGERSTRALTEWQQGFQTAWQIKATTAYEDLRNTTERNILRDGLSPTTWSKWRHFLLNIIKRPPAETPAEALISRRIDDFYFAKVESGFRTLKLIMEGRRDREAEGEFFRLELMARRKRSNVSPGLHFATDGYRLLSGYGLSVVRPVIWLFAIWLLCIPIFGLFHLDMDAVIAVFENRQAADIQAWLSLLATVPSHLVEAASVSASRIFPFGAFEDVSKDFATSLGQPYLKLIFRLLATVESFLALTLAFLFGLAVRRRFQIS
ncbi:pentapeptide repeat-containing protein [Asticcacaulis sp.]|uniref:pentapeptide repeat-containing protein n=1 Tax=Asticcacaulis sp. TaxID=1872648 RepID=UPI00260A6316|nr:pentapeptide repeat-containing protein [Asticcacaulis sp.]